jgi:hypothetical protein
MTTISASKRQSACIYAQSINAHIKKVVQHRDDVFDAVDYMVGLDPTMEDHIIWEDVVFHDLSKLSDKEIVAYSRKFMWSPGVDDDCSLRHVVCGMDFNTAWPAALQNHYDRNLHHP